MGTLGEEKLRFPREAATPLRTLDQQVLPLARLRLESRQGQMAGSSQNPNLPWRELIHPIRIENEPVGYIILSAWRPDGCPLESVRRLWLSWARDGLDVRWAELETAWHSLPLLTPSQHDAWSRQLQLVADENIRILERRNQPHFQPEHLPPLIREACETIRSRFTESLTLESVANSCGVSSEHLSRTFHHCTGLRFREYVAETRVQAVCAELESTRDSISDIAIRNGFSTLSRFNRTFRVHTGRTPREWRKRPPGTALRSAEQTTPPEKTSASYTPKRR